MISHLDQPHTHDLFLFIKACLINIQVRIYSETKHIIFAMSLQMEKTITAQFCIFEMLSDVWHGVVGHE